MIDSLLRDFDIKIINEYFNYKEYIQVLQEYRLLPTGTQIVLTCKHHGINTTLTFDEDFKRIPRLGNQVLNNN